MLQKVNRPGCESTARSSKAAVHKPQLSLRIMYCAIKLTHNSQLTAGLLSYGRLDIVVKPTQSSPIANYRLSKQEFMALADFLYGRFEWNKLHKIQHKDDNKTDDKENLSNSAM